MLLDWSEVGQAAFWVSALKIVWVNILLSGDNAVVLAMACRSLSPRHRLWAMILGAGAAVLLCIAFTFVVASLMLLPYLRVIGGIALLYIAARLLISESTDSDEVETVEHLWRAVFVVAVAETSMSLDNVIATAAAAHGNTALLVLGLAVSIPLIVAGAALVRALLDRFPILVWASAALLGWIAGEVLTTDPAIESFLLNRFSADEVRTVMLFAATTCAIATPAAGGLWRRRRQSTAVER